MSRWTNRDGWWGILRRCLAVSVPAVLIGVAATWASTGGAEAASLGLGGAVVVLSLDVLRCEPQPLVRRALAQACMRAGGERPTHERLTALHELASGHGEAGPVQMAGRVAAYRRRPSCGGGRAGTLELVLQPR